jgi:chromosome segregation ATPase
MSVSELLSLGAFVLSVLAGIIALSKRKSEVQVNDATAADQISEAWERLNKPNRERIDILERELSTTQQALTRAFGRIDELEKENRAKTEQIKTLEIEKLSLKTQIDIQTEEINNQSARITKQDAQIHRQQITINEQAADIKRLIRKTGPLPEQ